MFCFVFILYYIRAKQKHVHLFRYQRDWKETVMIIYHIFLDKLCELNMQDGSRYTRYVSVISGYPISTGFPRVDGLSTGPPG